MSETVEFVARNGYWVVFFGVLSEQFGVPLPTIFILIAAGALAGLGQLNLTLVLTLAVAAALVGDTTWFFIGRRRGLQVLGFLCRISLEPDSCVSGAKKVFTKHGARSLLVAKFIPGFTTFAQPLAGATGMPLARFLVFDAFGSLFWAGTLGVKIIYPLITIKNYTSRLALTFEANCKAFKPLFAPLTLGKKEYFPKAG